MAPSVNDLILLIGDKEVTIAIQRKQIQDLQAQVADLTEQIKKLTPNESAAAVTKKPQKG